MLSPTATASAMVGSDMSRFGQHLGLTGIVIASLVQRLLVQGRGHDTADASGPGQADALRHDLEGEAAAVGL